MKECQDGSYIDPVTEEKSKGEIKEQTCFFKTYLLSALDVNVGGSKMKEAHRRRSDLSNPLIIS